MEKQDSAAAGAAASETAAPKRRAGHRVIRLAGVLLLLAFLALVLWTGFSGLSRKPSLSLIPTGYGLYLHTDSVWEAVNPMLDLQAADILLATRELSGFRPLFIGLRQSELRDNRLLALAASRPVDVGFYFGRDNQRHFVAVVDMGFLSAATRLAKYWVPRIPLEASFPGGITTVQGSGGHHFELETSMGTIYFKDYHNTVIVSSSKDLFQQALLGTNDALYTPAERRLLTADSGNPVQIVADASSLALAATENSPALQKLATLIRGESKALVSFGITDQKIDLRIDLPLDLSDTAANRQDVAAVRSLLQQESSLPLLLPQLGSNIQYYTILNIGSLAQLKEATLPLLPASLDAQGLWNTADSLSTSFFGVNLQELVFSWAGGECAIMGVEGLKDPAIALEVRDENMRQFIFDRLLSSIILQDDTSLILNGVRLPRLQLPVFLQGVMRMLNINMPSPYYMVHQGFIYLSESPETLSALFTSMQGGERLSSNEGWTLVAEDHKKETSVSLFYDLEQSTPFFLQGDNVVVQILELYAMGLLDLQLQDGSLVCQLSVAARPSGQLRSIPGFPLTLAGKAGQFHQVAGKNAKHLFWVENGTTLKVLDVASMGITEKVFRSPIVVAPASQSTKSGVIWAVTAEGAVYLLTETLADAPSFPLLTGAKPATTPTATERGIILPMDDDSICFVSSDGTSAKEQLELAGAIMSPPRLLDGMAAFYDKGFSGHLLVVDTERQSLSARQQVFGIAYGSPALLKRQRDTYLGFVTQAGRLSVWKIANSTDENDLRTTEQVAETSLPGLFFTNLVSDGSSFFALSAEGRLFRIDTEGNSISVQIPNATARNGIITVIPDAKSSAQSIYVGVDGNVIYGFNSNLELLQGFPLAGSGVPVFVDANGDGRKDCLALTIDNRLNGWNLR